MNALKAALLVSLATFTTAFAQGCAVDAEAPDGDDTGTAAEAISSSTTSGWGWVWANQATGTYPPSSAYSFNSAGGTNQVTNTGTGMYRVDFPSLADLGGNVQVSAYGGGSERCKVEMWGTNGSTLNVYVRCHTVAGVPVNTNFVVFYGREIGNGSGSGAYLWNDQASAALNVAYTPQTSYQFNSSGSYSTLTRLNTGTYRAKLAGQIYNGGDVQVTAYGSGLEYCKVAGWSVSGSDTLVDVRCFGAVGASVDARFSLSYVRGRNFGGVAVGGYAWADNSASSSYSPNASYAELFATTYPCYYGPGITAGRNGLGSFFVQYPNEQGTNSTALVTAYGYGNEYCKIGGWAPSGGGAHVTVQCFDYTGAPVDTLFTSAYLDNEARTPC